MYPSSDVTRIPTAGTDMYIRNISVKNNLSCNKVVQGGPSNLWDSYDILDNMTHDYKCDLAHNTKNEQKHYNTANKKLNQAVHNVQDKLSSLTDTGLSLTGEMQNQVKKRRKGFEDYEYIRANLGNVQDTITNVSALEEDTDVLLISDNYKYILWSILAIVFVIAGIKLSRK
jgi:predicted nucleotidyltransferase